MKKNACVVCAFSLGVVVNCYSNSLEWGVARWEYDNGEYMLNLVTSLPWYPPLFPTQSLGFRTQVNASAYQGVFQNFRPSWSATPYYCALLPVASGTLIDNALYASCTGDWLAHIEIREEDGWPIWVEPYAVNGLEVPLTDQDSSNTVLVAFALYSIVFDGYMIDYYGWLEFGYNGTNIYLVNSAMEMTGQGVFAGVPEPSTALLALAGLVAFGLRRRKAT